MKKFFIFINTFVLSTVLTLYVFALSTGDINGNGKIDAGDARLVLRYSAKLDTLTEEQTAVADIDCNNKVNATDARLLLRISAKLDTITQNTLQVSDKTELKSTDIYKEATEYTVEIHCFDKNGDESFASAFFIDGNGTLATNYHVIKDAYTAYIIDCNENKYDVTKVISYNKDKDIALITVEKKNESYATLSYTYLTGETVYTLGSPLGLTGTFSSGMISCAEREFSDLKNSVKYIQFTAPITSGNSGGPLINAYGEVIGINSMSYTSAQNLNFAVPVYELSTLPTNSSMTLTAFYNLIHSTGTDDSFSGVILPYTSNVTLSKNSTYTLYVVGIANSDYTIMTESTDGFTAKTGTKSGNVTPVYLTADGSAKNGKIKLYFDKNNSIYRIISVQCK